MFIEANEATFLTCSIMSVIDISLTYYILWYDRKINKIPLFKELNPLAAWIMKVTKYGPLGLLSSLITSQMLIWGITLWLSIYSPGQAYYTITFMSGAIFLVIWIHIHSIKGLHKLYATRQAIKEILK